MMANARDFPILFPLYDVTIQALSPNTTGAVTPVQGANGAAGQNTYMFVTPGTIPNGSGALPSGLAAEALLIEIIPPVVVNGGNIVYPDFQLWFYPDSTDLRNPTPAGQLILDGSYGANMMPPRENTVGRVQVPLGISLRRLLTEAANGHARSNMPLLATGVKYNSTLQLKVQSKRGWGPGVAGDAIQVPGRVRVWGERYSDKMLGLLAGHWNGQFSRSGLRRQIEASEVPPAISGVQAGVVSVATIASLPGGYNQSNGAKVFRDFRFAYPAIQTSTNAPFLLSNSSQVGAASGNVDPQYSGDLGFPFAPVNGVASNAKSAVIIQQFGVTPGNPNIAYAGFQIGGATVPDPNGFPVGYALDRQAYGNVQPIRNASEMWFALPDLDGEIDVFAENAVVFITANGTTPIAAGSVAVALGGVSIQLP
jgi:hypothetical protein